ALEPRVLFCQHRGRVEQGAARLRDKLDFLVELGERIHELHGRGWSDAAIARALPGSDFLWRVWAGGGVSKRDFVWGVARTSGGTVTHASPRSGSTTRVARTSAVRRTRPSGVLAYTDS